MATTDLVATTTAEQPSAPPRALIRRPAEAVELSERVYRGIFSAGIVVALIATAYAATLGVVQPEDGRLRSVAAAILLGAVEVGAFRCRQELYVALRCHPWRLLGAGLIVGAGAAAMGTHNQQAFYVLTLAVGSIGIATTLPAVATSAVLASLGMVLPHLLTGSSDVGPAVAAMVVPPLFFLIVEQLAGFMLGLYRPAADAEPRAEPANRQHSPARAGATEYTRRPTQSRLLGRGIAPFSPVQFQILLLVTEGLNNGEIAECLPFGVQQVRRHLNAAEKRVGVVTTAELVAWAMAAGLLAPPRTQVAEAS